MERIEVAGGPHSPGDVVEGTVSTTGQGTIALVVSRLILRPLSSQPTTRWIAHRSSTELVSDGDSASFSLTLPRLEDLEDVPEQPWLAKQIARLLRVEVTPLEWELSLEVEGEGLRTTLRVPERRAA